MTQAEQNSDRLKEAERKVEKSRKQAEENAILCEKLAESEQLRKRFMEKNQQQEK